MLKEYLDHEISTPEAAAYYAFCRQANSDLIRHSLKELKGFAKSAKRLKAAGKDAPPFLPKLTRIYFRKVEEQARLFTALSIFEAAYRVHLATWMEQHYGVKKWWDPVYTTLIGGGGCAQVTNISGVELTPAVANAIDKLLKGIDGYDLKGATVVKQANGHSLLCYSKLSDLEELIKEQWVSFKASLRIHNPSLTALPSFISAFKRIRDSRNSCFHHREVSDRPGLLRSIENMLDLIDIHLDTASINARTSAVKPMTTGIQWHERHNFGLVQSLTYDIELHFEDQKSRSTIDGRTQFEAIQRAIDGVAADDRLKLKGIQIQTRAADLAKTDIEEAIKKVGVIETRFQQ
ncbi:hypothetical protein [Mesorhizobium cantuariense]|uniref:Abi-like protein n=1 Tax=Mesorhizobium cantuariense TaxID=1300275 RepID=A0ABV7MYA7_9HYPH